MKTYLQGMTLIALLCFCGSMHAQQLVIGVKGGFSIPNLSAGKTQNPLNSGYTSRFGPDFSIYGGYQISNLISVTLGMEYSSQGGKKDKFQAYAISPDMAAALGTPYLYANYKSEAKMNYLLMPLMIRFSWDLGYGRSTRFYAAVGPFAGYLLDAHQVTSGSSKIYMDAAGTLPLASDPQSFDGNTNIKSDLYTFNYGVDGLVGVVHHLSERHAVFIEIGGNYGFRSIQKKSINGSNYTGAGVVSLGYAYALKFF